MIEDKLVSTFPTNQNAIDCFPDLWYSKFPESYQLESGESLLFQDHRLIWALQQLQPQNLWDVVELGPLEGGHSFYMENHTPVRSITAIEANRLCWVKCLVTKEIVDLKKTRFLLGNFLEYLDQCPKQFDLCLGIGVLYHMKDPLELIRLISQRSKRLVLWTQLVNEKQKKERNTIQLQDEGFEVTGYINNYGEAVDLGKFIGGIDDYAVWLTKEGLLDALTHFGFNKIKVWEEGEKMGDTQFGSQTTLVAEQV